MPELLRDGKYVSRIGGVFLFAKRDGDFCVSLTKGLFRYL